MTQGGWTPWPQEPRRETHGHQPPRPGDPGQGPWWPDGQEPSWSGAPGPPWPDGARSGPGDDRSWPDETGSLWPPTAALVPVAAKRRPYPSPSLTLPIIGTVLVAASTAALWVAADSARAGGLLGAWYVSSGAAYAVALLATVYAFAANLDSTVLRWLHAGLGLCAGAAVALLGAAFRPGSAANTAYTVLAVLTLLTLGVGFLVGLAMLPRLGKRPVDRAVGAAVPLLAAGLHLAAVNSLFTQVPVAAHLMGVGCLFFAAGAVVGPRYR